MLILDQPPQLILPNHWQAKRPAIIRPADAKLLEAGVLPGVGGCLAGASKEPLAIVNSAASPASPSAGATTYTFNLPPSLVVGRLLLAFVTSGSSINITQPTGWTNIGQQRDTNGTGTIQIFAKIVDGTEGATATVTNSASAQDIGVCYQISGNRSGLTTSEIVFAGVGTAATTSPQTPSLTPGWGAAENLWFSVICPNAPSFMPTGYPPSYVLGQLRHAADFTDNKTDPGSVMASARLLSAATETPGTHTGGSTSISAFYAAVTLAIRPQ